MSFADDINRFTLIVRARTQAVYDRAVALTFESIVDGSPITGAPGQPVDTGNLRNSWQVEPLSATSARISTNVDYAPIIEDNERGVTFKNHGPHSVKQTIAGFDRIVATAAAEVRGG